MYLKVNFGETSNHVTNDHSEKSNFNIKENSNKMWMWFVRRRGKIEARIIDWINWRKKRRVLLKKFLTRGNERSVQLYIEW